MSKDQHIFQEVVRENFLEMSSFIETVPTEIENELGDVIENITLDSTVETEAEEPLSLVEECEPINPAILEDHAFIREFVPAAAILTLTKEFVTVILIRTAYARIQLRIQFMSRYPHEPPIVELSSPTLPLPLLRNKEKICMDLAKEKVGHSQVQVIYAHLHHFIQTNLFIPCWKEMKSVMSLCEGKGQIGADDKEGVISLRLQQGRYRQAIKLKVPPSYPEEGVAIEFTTSNFPADMQYMFRSQAEEIVRRCVSGFSPEQATQTSGTVQLPGNKLAEKGPRLTAGTLKTLKHDVVVLKQISDLRVLTSAKDRKHQYSVQANAERREARKDLRRLAKAESDADQELERHLRDLEQQEMKDLLRTKTSDVAQLSLFAAAKFLVEDYACRLPQELCQGCRCSALPENPNSEALTNSQSEMRPMRTFCGHWLHYKCLNDWLTTPPFVRQCPVCDRRIWHSDWPADHKVLEKAWQTKEARKREVSDVSETDFVCLIFSSFFFHSLLHHLSFQLFSPFYFLVSSHFVFRHYRCQISWAWDRSSPLANNLFPFACNFNINFIICVLIILTILMNII